MGRTTLAATTLQKESSGRVRFCISILSAGILLKHTEMQPRSCSPMFGDRKQHRSIGVAVPFSCFCLQAMVMMMITTAHAQSISLRLSPIDGGGVRLTVQGSLDDLSGLSTNSPMTPIEETPNPLDPCGERFDEEGNYVRNFWFIDGDEGARVGDWCGGGALYTFDREVPAITLTHCPVVVRTVLSMLGRQRFPVVGFGMDNDGEATVWLPQGYMAGTELMGSAFLVEPPSLADMFDASFLLLAEGSPICGLEWTSPTTGMEQQIEVYVGDNVAPPTVPHNPKDENDEEREVLEPIQGFLGFLGRVGEGMLRGLNVMALFFAKLRER